MKDEVLERVICRDGGVISGIGIDPPEQRGWMKNWGGSRVHWFTRMDEVGDVVEWRSLCGLQALSSPRVPMFSPGNWPRCSHCQRMARLKVAR